MNQKLFTILVIIVLLAGGIFLWNQREISTTPTTNDSTYTEQEGSKSIPNTSNWKTYRDEEYGLEFKYPSDFEVYISEPELDGVKNLNISVKKDSDFLADINFTGLKLTIPSEGGCWPYSGQSIDLSRSTDEIKQEIQKRIPNIEIVTKREIDNNIAVQFYCIGSYATVFFTKNVVVPIHDSPYTNLTISSGVLLSSDLEYDNTTPQEWKQAINNLKHSIVTDQYKINVQSKEKEILFDQFIDSIKFFKNKSAISTTPTQISPSQTID